MKILLINPPSENELLGNNPSIIEEERGYNPPLGILYIAGYLEKHTNFGVEVIDTQAEEIGYDRLKDVIRAKLPDVVGITAMTFTLIDVIKVINLIKSIRPEIKIVLGGPHVHIYPEETINIRGVDFLVLGEGEVTFKELVENIDNPARLSTIPGLVFKENGRVINTGARPLNEDLDSLPFPARHLTPVQKYSSLMARRIPITTMFTSRGCPYRCTFCDRPHLGKNFRARSAMNVVDEMEENELNYWKKIGTIVFLVVVSLIIALADDSAHPFLLIWWGWIWGIIFLIWLTAKVIQYFRKNN